MINTNIYIYIYIYIYICVCVSVCVCVYGRRPRRWHSTSCKYTHPSRNPASLEWTTADVGLHVNAHRIEYMCFNQRGDISTLNNSSLKLVDMSTYIGSSVSSTETYINTWLTKAWIVIDRLSVIWKSDLTGKIKRIFSKQRSYWYCYGCTTWTISKRIEKKNDGNHTRMLWAILKKSWRQNPAKQQLYAHLPPITKLIKVRRTRQAGHCWRGKEELISDELRWIPSHGRSKAERLAWNIYTAALCRYGM